jgi:hypothetical protein
MTAPLFISLQACAKGWRRVSLLAVAVAAGLAAASCSSSPAPVCNAPVELVPALLYPSPGATAVAENIGELIIGNTTEGVSYALSEATGSATPAALGTGGPVPSPAPTSFPTNEFVVAVPLPSLEPATAYKVIYSYSIPACGGGTERVSGSFGSFST